MKKAMKVLGILLCAVLLVVGSVAATLAYLTSVTQTVTNTFAVGDVEITLDEAWVNDKGQPINAQQEVVSREAAKRVATNNYHFMPTVASYTKDPTVTVKAGSDASYVRILVKMEGMTWDAFAVNTDYNAETSKWKCVNKDAADNAVEKVYEFRYEDIVPATTGDENTPAADVNLDPLFTVINRGANHTYDALANLDKITLEAHAIQAEGFNASGTVGEEGYVSAVDAAWIGFGNSGMLSPSENA